MRKSRWTAAVMAGILAAGVLAGCSSDSETAATTAGSQAENSQEAAGNAADGSVWAQGSTVYFDVPAKAGGGTDLYTRYLTQALAEVCPGVNFIVTNYDTSEVGMEHVKNADPDGLTLGTCHGGAIIQYLAGSSEVNIKDDLRVVGILNQGGPQAIIAKPGAPYTNLKELGEYVKANPGEVVVGCSLGGTTQVLFTSLIEAVAGDASLVNYVQCSSEADKLTNVASGAIDIANCSIPNALSYDADGKLTVLGSIGPKVATLKNMGELVGAELDAKFATTQEQGFENTWDSNYYVMAPKDTPDEVCEAINEAIRKATEVQSFIDGNNSMATYIAAIDLAGSQEALNAEWDFQDELVTSMGLKVR
ncbi:MAG: tripartite tricarboxylate transporter substrate-binding protein [Eubacteriales bacterium]|nr:tripartite tricarboxylate transporter substrate-binding protein [Eubacteriales bacterium]